MFVFIASIFFSVDAVFNKFPFFLRLNYITHVCYLTKKLCLKSMRGLNVFFQFLRSWYLQHHNFQSNQQDE